MRIQTPSQSVKNSELSLQNIRKIRVILKSRSFGPKFAFFEHFSQVTVAERLAFHDFKTSILSVCRKAPATLQRGRRCMTTGLPLWSNGVPVATP